MKGGPETGRFSSLYGLLFVVTFLEFAFLEKLDFSLALEQTTTFHEIGPIEKPDHHFRADYFGTRRRFGLGCVYTAEHIHRPAFPPVPGGGDFGGGSTFSGGGGHQ